MRGAVLVLPQQIVDFVKKKKSKKINKSQDANIL